MGLGLIGKHMSKEYLLIKSNGQWDLIADKAFQDKQIKDAKTAKEPVLNHYTSHDFDQFKDSAIPKKEDNALQALGPGHYFTTGTNKDIQEYTKAKYKHSVELSEHQHGKLADIYEPLTEGFLNKMKEHADNSTDEQHAANINRIHGFLSNIGDHYGKIGVSSEKHPKYPTHSAVYGALEEPAFKDILKDDGLRSYNKMLDDFGYHGVRTSNHGSQRNTKNNIRQKYLLDPDNSEVNYFSAKNIPPTKRTYI